MTPTLFTKYLDDIARPTATLIRLAPADRLSWVPGPQNFMSLGQLLHHLPGCPRLCATVAREALPPPEEMRRRVQEDLQKTATPEQALRGLEEGLREAKEAVEGIGGADWETRIVRGLGRRAPMSRALLDATYHWLHHKMQLFLYLKLLGLPVNTMTLYVGEMPAARA